MRQGNFQQYGSKIPSTSDNNGQSLDDENAAVMDTSYSSVPPDVPYISTTVKIKEEIASPFRRLRQFLYIGCFMGGGLGFVTALPALLIALQRDGSDAISSTTALTNVAVDLAGVLGGILLWIRESKDEQEKLLRFAQKEQRQASRLSDTDIIDRSKEISRLPIEIIFSDKDESATRIVSVGDLQGKGRQNIVIVVGKKSIVKDALISARIEGNELFNSKDTIIVPLVIDDKQLVNSEEKSNIGFGKNINGSNEALMEAPYIAKPAQVLVWERYLRKEIELAENQGTKNVLGQGLIIAVKRNGQVGRRGIGLPPWKTLLNEL